MKDTKYLEIIKAPVITEKSENARSEGKYTFKCDPKATKLEIKEAIEKYLMLKLLVLELLMLNQRKEELVVILD